MTNHKTHELIPQNKQEYLCLHRHLVIFVHDLRFDKPLGWWIAFEVLMDYEEI